MSDDPAAPPGEKARQFFDDLWRKGDYWALESSPFERDKYARQIQRIADRRYRTVLEIGCGAGLFTRTLATLADRVVAIDVSPVAIEQARAATSTAAAAGVGVIDYRVADVIDYQPEDDGPFDLIV